MKSIKIVLTVILSSALLLAGCQSKEAADVVTTSFVGYDIVRALAGDELTIENIIPWGSELHDFDPSPQNMASIGQSSLFVYTSEDIEPWAKDAKAKLVLSLSEAEDESHEHDHEHEHEDGHNHGSHFWTDPMVFVEMIEMTQESLVKAFPEKQVIFEENAESYIEEIKAIDTDLKTFLSKQSERTIYLSGHNALDGLSEHYGLSIISLQDTYRPNADVSAKEIIALRDKMKESKTTVLYHEELVDPLVAKQIQTDLVKQGFEIELLELHGYHNITQQQFDEGVTYRDLFKQNSINLKQGLGH